MSPEEAAARAFSAYRAMRRRFWSGERYRRDGLIRLPGSAAHLWPFSRALGAVLDLAGIAPELRPSDFDPRSAIAEHLAALESYWDGDCYSSDIVGSRGPGGDRYYDDNAWIGLALVQLERLERGAADLDRAAALFRFALGGWDSRGDVPHPGGVFWVEQGRGLGLRNHDRNVVSNAPNAELGLHLTELGRDFAADATRMYDWVDRALDSGGDRGGPYWDKIRGDGSLDTAVWSYNQGSMIGANVLLHRLERAAFYLERAETIARRTLAARHAAEPAAFNAILFRNLLQLNAATGDRELRAQIVEAVSGYAERLWSGRDGRDDLFRFSRAGPTLLDQGALVQIFAVLAWDPGDYQKLA